MTKSRQRGVVLIFSLIILLILTIGAVALMRSMNASAVSAGNLAFHRDLVNQGEQAIATVVANFKSGTVPAGGTTVSDPTANYSATALTATPQGVPNALLNSGAFLAVGIIANDLPGATSDVSMRYVVDRLCNVAGTASTATCVQAYSNPLGVTINHNTGLPPPSATVYRLTVRVNGPRSTQAFLQTTFTKPD